MAVTGFWPVFKNLKATLDYADNPDKTTAPEYLDEDLYAALRYAENDDKTDREMFVGGIKLSYLLIGMGGAGTLLLIAGKFVPYVHKRIVSWRDPFADTSAAGYQIVQSLYSIGSGGFLGLGLGQSRQKYLYLPEEHNDYIFAIVCEELGLVGALGVMALYAALILRGYRIALAARDRFSTVLAAGLTTLIAVQTVLNLCVVTNLLPSTGIALPFFSYGGTALAVNLGQMGIILGISRQKTQKQEANP